MDVFWAILADIKTADTVIPRAMFTLSRLWATIEKVG